jgi:PAS domain S-box-containing protein
MHPPKPDQLRARAEELLRARRDEIQDIPVDDIKELIHELQVHQIELEMQNEELRRTQIELEDSRNKYFDLFDLAPIGYLTLNQEGLIQEVNLTAADLLGVERRYLIGRGFSRFIAPDFQDVFYHHHKKAFETRTKQGCELKLFKKDGTSFHVQVESVAAQDAEGNFNQLRMSINDITERKRAEEQVEASLKEKEVLLREIHHRVKNNMQVIASLLKMQCRHIKDDRVKALLEESENRVKAMVLVQELLYESDSLAEIDLKKYIDKLVDSIFRGCRLGGQVTWKSDVEAVTLSIDQAAPFGLAFSEILTNSLKHGFPQDEPGEITVRSRLLENGHVELVIRDSGSGLPDRIDIRNTKTLGLRLVTGLVENQLGGVVELNRKKGTQFTIRFPRKAAQG